MPLTLILMRHAKSAWGDLSLDDFDRPLNGRGGKSAPAIAKWLVDNGHVPDHATVSSAARTVETWDRMAGVLPNTVTMDSTRKLYLAGPDIILDVLRAQSASCQMIVCHNPGIAMFAHQICSAPHPHPDFSRYPTAATAIIQFDAKTWSQVEWNTGRVIDFVVPRDLLS